MLARYNPHHLVINLKHDVTISTTHNSKTDFDIIIKNRRLT